MYTPAPSAAEMEANGVTPADYEHEVFEVWPDNWPAFQLFHQVQTQWRAGAVGLVGLDYNVLFHKMDRMNLSTEEYEGLEDDIRAMELEALSAMQKKT